MERLEKEVNEMASKIWKSPATYDWRAGGGPSMYSQASGPTAARTPHGESEKVSPTHSSKEDEPANLASIYKGSSANTAIIRGPHHGPPGMSVGSGPFHHQAMLTYNHDDHRNNFSEKVAVLKEYMHDGEHKGAQWRLIVRPYLISRAP